MISLFEMFKIGIGPSSSHTMGPMVASSAFLTLLKDANKLDSVNRIQVDLYGSLASTGKGHATDTAVILGLLGHKADNIDTNLVTDYLDPVLTEHHLKLAGERDINFHYDADIVWHPLTNLPHHPNGMSLTAYFADEDDSLSQTYYSIGGGFIATAEDLASSENGDDTNENLDQVAKTTDAGIPYPFQNAQDWLDRCQDHGVSLSEVMLANEKSLRDEETIFAYIDAVWEVMQTCVKNGCESDGILPGGLKVKRRAKVLHDQLVAELSQNQHDSQNPTPKHSPDHLLAMDWVDLYALAVNEENANGGRVVTAPTNGAAGIIPAVLHYYRDFIDSYSPDGVRDFMLTAAAIGMIIKQNASISGAEVGCQGEVGSACAMAAAGLASVLGLSPAQCANAAEIGIEHNLGLTCDPIGGLVQVPCIERNAMAAVKAINAARLAKRGDGQHHVSLDKAIATMKATGEDMMDKYKETAMGGLAVYVPSSDDALKDSSNRIAVVDPAPVSVGYPQC